MVSKRNMRYNKQDIKTITLAASVTTSTKNVNQIKNGRFHHFLCICVYCAKYRTGQSQRVKSHIVLCGASSIEKKSFINKFASNRCDFNLL